MSDPFDHPAYARWRENSDVCAHGQVTRNCVACESDAMEKMIEDYYEALAFIADYADPDFPMEDWEGHAKRAESIYMMMRQLAQVVLGRPLFRGPML